MTRRRWPQFSLRTMLVLTTVLCCWLGWNAHVVRQRQEALEWLVANGGGTSDWMQGSPGDSVPLPWIRQLLGDKPVNVIWKSPEFDKDEKLRFRRLFPEAAVQPPLPTPTLEETTPLEN